MSISKNSVSAAAATPRAHLPDWARAVLPPADDGEWAVVVRTNLSVRSFADLHGVDRGYMRKLVDAGRVFLVRHLQEMTTLELARHSGYSPVRIRRMVASGVLPPLYRRANGAPIFLEDQLPQAPEHERWQDPMRKDPYRWAQEAAADLRLRAIWAKDRRTRNEKPQDDWNERVRAAQVKEKADRAADRQAREDAKKVARAQTKRMRELMRQARLAQGKAAPRARGHRPSGA